MILNRIEIPSSDVSISIAITDLSSIVNKISNKFTANDVFRVEIELEDVNIYPKKISILDVNDSGVSLIIPMPYNGWKIGKQWIQISLDEIDDNSYTDPVTDIQWNKLTKIEIYHSDTTSAKSIFYDMQILKVESKYFFFLNYENFKIILLRL